MIGLRFRHTFSTAELSEQQDSGYSTPPEFACYARSALDAYATAHVAAWGNPQGHGELEVSCSLKHSECSIDDLFLEFTARFDGELIPSTQQLMISLLTDFPAALKAKRIGFGVHESATNGVVFFGRFHRGCLMTWDYPGKLIASKSPCLNRRPVDAWPQATIKIALNAEVCYRAKSVMDFLLDPTTGRHPTN